VWSSWPLGFWSAEGALGSVPGPAPWRANLATDGYPSGLSARPRRSETETILGVRRANIFHYLLGSAWYAIAVRLCAEADGERGLPGPGMIPGRPFVAGGEHVLAGVHAHSESWLP
jgi:hypothetical protein